MAALTQKCCALPCFSDREIKKEKVKGPSNLFPEKVKLINTHIMRTYFPLILGHKSEAYDAFYLLYRKYKQCFNSLYEFI